MKPTEDHIYGPRTHSGEEGLKKMGECVFCQQERPTKFCAVCGVDYCGECKLTHDANHEYVAEAIGLGELVAED